MGVLLHESHCSLHYNPLIEDASVGSLVMV